MKTTAILIIGASGQLGRAFQYLAKNSAFRQMMKAEWPDSYQLTFTHRATLDLLDKSAVQNGLKGFTYCINCAAYTDVDKAETAFEKAFEINAKAVRHLAKACKEKNVKLIHFSTDYVYDSGQTKPYKEEDPLNPRSIYAKSKLQGEQYAFEENPNTLIFRTSWLFSPFGKNFYNSMKKLGRERKELGVVYDQIGTPTSALHLAKATLKAIQRIENGLKNWQGIYNFSQSGVASWYDFAYYIMQLEKLPCHIYPICTEAFPRPAPRPPFSVMDKSKFEKQFGWTPCHWMESLECVSELFCVEKKP